MTRITNIAGVASFTIVGPTALFAYGNDTSTSFDPPTDADVDVDVIEIDGETVAALSWSRRTGAAHRVGASTRG